MAAAIHSATAVLAVLVAAAAPRTARADCSMDGSQTFASEDEYRAWCSGCGGTPSGTGATLRCDVGSSTPSSSRTGMTGAEATLIGIALILAFPVVPAYLMELLAGKGQPIFGDPAAARRRWNEHRDLITGLERFGRAVSRERRSLRKAIDDIRDEIGIREAAAQEGPRPRRPRPRHVPVRRQRTPRPPLAPAPASRPPPPDPKDYAFCAPSQRNDPMRPPPDADYTAWCKVCVLDAHSAQCDQDEECKKRPASCACGLRARCWYSHCMAGTNKSCR